MPRTPDQDILDALQATGWARTLAAHRLGISTRAIASRIAALKGRGIEIPPSPYKGIPYDHPDAFNAPKGFVATGVSTLHGPDGQVKAQWVKSTADRAQQEALMREAVAALSEKVPRAKPATAPSKTNEKLLNLVTFTDFHLGMYSWAEETGADWDIGIAERVIAGAFEYMLTAAPKAAVCYVNQGGDFLHTDGFKALTPTSGHLLDADTRYQKIVRVAIRVLRRITDLALARHERVVVNMLDANHDPVGGTWLRELFASLYENEPRIAINTSPSPYVAYQHGRTMLGFHHGHGTKPEKLPLLFASRFPDIWGATRFRYCHIGHLHHVEEKEHAGMTVVRHPTLAAADAYAAREGYDAQRMAQTITYHADHGQVGRTFVTPEMLA